MAKPSPANDKPGAEVDGRHGCAGHLKYIACTLLAIGGVISRAE
jgi:hypothetical protein